MRRSRFLPLAALLFLIGAVVGVESQGTLSAQVLRLLDRVNTWSAAQTFGAITVTGLCTGCTGTAAVVQGKNTQTGAVATGTTLIPLDDTIPQNTEGDQYLSLAITPTSATNKLKIDIVVNSTFSVTAWITAALFQDSTAGALAAFTNYQQTGTAGNNLVFSYWMTTGTTSATTFKVRAGGQTAGTLTLNGQAAGRLMGGVMASSMTITEIVP